MCEPMVMMAAGGAGSSVLGEHFEQEDIRKQAQGTAAAYGTKAEFSDLSARDAYERGRQAERGVRIEGAKIEGNLVASMGASGLDVNSHSFSQLVAGSAAMEELDVQTARNNAAREAWGHRKQAEVYRSQRAKTLRDAEEELGIKRWVGFGMKQLGGVTAQHAGGRPSIKG